MSLGILKIFLIEIVIIIHLVIYLKNISNLNILHNEFLLLEKKLCSNIKDANKITDTVTNVFIKNLYFLNENQLFLYVSEINKDKDKYNLFVLDTKQDKKMKNILLYNGSVKNIFIDAEYIYILDNRLEILKYSTIDMEKKKK